MGVKEYERVATVPVNEVLKAIAECKPLEVEGAVCYTTGTRLLTYHVHGVKCCVPGCSVSGQFFAIEKQSTSSYHLNLYGIKDGREVMITSDHKFPKSRGGSDHINNRQPMCMPHNFQKGNKLIHL